MIGAKVEAKMKILYERNRDYIENEKLLRKSSYQKEDILKLMKKVK